MHWEKSGVARDEQSPAATAERIRLRVGTPGRTTQIPHYVLCCAGRSGGLREEPEAIRCISELQMLRNIQGSGSITTSIGLKYSVPWLLLVVCHCQSLWERPLRSVGHIEANDHIFVVF